MAANILDLVSTPFQKKSKRLKVLFVATEAAPFAKVGGLGEVMYSLPKALRGLGYDARIMIPRYLCVDREKYALKMLKDGLKVPSGGEAPPLICNVLTYEGEDTVPAYFLENQEYYEKRANVYGYADDPTRWVLLSRGVIEFLRNSEWAPDVIVANDWQTGFIPNLIHSEHKDDPVIDRVATVFVIHNLYHQGMFDHKFVSEMNFDAGQDPVGDMFNPRIPHLNGMKRGIMYSDAIATVSPTYAREILTKDYGEGLENLLQERRARLFGVINGIDYERSNPETDPYIAARFSVKNFSARRPKNKEALQEHFGLSKNPKAFLAAIVSRMDHQKGFDLLLEIGQALIDNIDLQLVVLGSGENKYRLFFKDLAEKFPTRVAGHFDFDPVLPHHIFSGADAVLIPSLFEPSGLTQMEAMRYGCIPIARKTGGLADTIIDYRGEKGVGYGFLFETFSPLAFFTAVVRARETFRYPAIWNDLVRRAMEKDFSWTKSAEVYSHIFTVATEYHKRLK